MALELVGEVGLVAEADVGGDAGDRLAVEEASAGGVALNRVVDDPRARRAVSAALGLVLAASVAFIWV